MEDHVGHRLGLYRVRGYSPVWGDGEGLELRCEDCDCLLAEYAIGTDPDDGEDD